MSYYPANNNLQMPLAYAQYPSLSLQQPTVSTQSIATPLASQVFISDVVPLPRASGTTPTQKTLFQRARAAVTVRRVAKTVLVIGLIAAVATFLGNAYQSTLAPSVHLKSVRPYCSSSSPCSTGSPLSLLMNIEVGPHPTWGDWNFDVTVFLPQNITYDFTEYTTYQHIGQGRLLSRTQNSMQDFTATVASIQQDQPSSVFVQLPASPYADSISYVVGIIQLPASPQTDSIVTKMSTNGILGTPVAFEINTHIHQWFKDLQFATQTTVSVSSFQSV